MEHDTEFGPAGSAHGDEAHEDEAQEDEAREDEAAGAAAAASAQGAGSASGAAESAPRTGEPRVDAALRLRDKLPGLPVSEHPALFEQVHAQLSDVLGELDSGPASAAGQVGS
jgi:hypothetical protein